MRNVGKMSVDRFGKGEIMKKNTSKLLLFMMVLIMSLSLVACGSDKENSKETKASQESQKQGESIYDTVADFVNSDESQKSFETLKKSLEGSGMNLEITAEDDKLVYTYTYEKIEKTDEMAAQLESMAAQDSTLQNTANGIQKCVNVDTVTVIARYVDCNGEEIYSKECVSE